MPHKIPTLEYPDRFKVRYVSANGGIRCEHDWVSHHSIEDAYGKLLRSQ